MQQSLISHEGKIKMSKNLKRQENNTKLMTHNAGLTPSLLEGESYVQIDMLSLQTSIH